MAEKVPFCWEARTKVTLRSRSHFHMAYPYKRYELGTNRSGTRIGQNTFADELEAGVFRRDSNRIRARNQRLDKHPTFWIPRHVHPLTSPHTTSFSSTTTRRIRTKRICYLLGDCHNVQNHSR